jgi:hypothetical protein
MSSTTVRKTQADRPRLKLNSLHETRSGSHRQSLRRRSRWRLWRARRLRDLHLHLPERLSLGLQARKPATDSSRPCSAQRRRDHSQPLRDIRWRLRLLPAERQIHKLWPRPLAWRGKPRRITGLLALLRERPLGEDPAGRSVFRSGQRASL